MNTETSLPSGPSNSSNSSVKFFRLFSKGPETLDNGPWVTKFYQFIKQNEKWQADLTKNEHGIAGYNSFSLLIKHVELKTFVDPIHGTKHSAKLHGQTADGAVSLDLPFNHQTYGILNALVSQAYDKSQFITIEVWSSQGKEKTKNYANAKVLDSKGTKIEWKVTPEQMPKGTEYTMPSGQLAYDNGAVTVFWLKCTARIAEQFAAINGPLPERGTAPVHQHNGQPTPEPTPINQPTPQPIPSHTGQQPAYLPASALNTQQGPPADYFSDNFDQDGDELPF